MAGVVKTTNLVSPLLGMALRTAVSSSFHIEQLQCITYKTSTAELNNSPFLQRCCHFVPKFSKVSWPIDSFLTSNGAIWFVPNLSLHMSKLEEIYSLSKGAPCIKPETTIYVFTNFIQFALSPITIIDFDTQIAFYQVWTIFRK